MNSGGEGTAIVTQEVKGPLTCDGSFGLEESPRSHLHRPRGPPLLGPSPKSEPAGMCSDSCHYSLYAANIQIFIKQMNSKFEIVQLKFRDLDFLDF